MIWLPFGNPKTRYSIVWRKNEINRAVIRAGGYRYSGPHDRRPIQVLTTTDIRGYSRCAVTLLHGIGTPEYQPRLMTRRERVFYCRTYSHISMVGRAGQPKGWPVG
jgi:hypothetical protein